MSTAALATAAKKASSHSMAPMRASPSTASYAGTSSPMTSRPGAYYTAGPALSLRGAVQMSMMAPSTSTAEHQTPEREKQSFRAPVQRMSETRSPEPVQRAAETNDASPAPTDSPASAQPTQLQREPVVSDTDAARATASPVQLDVDDGEKPSPADEPDTSNESEPPEIQAATEEPRPATRTPGSVQAVATAGMQGTAQPLPGMSRIQASFGAHELPRIQAYVGGPAADANKQLGSKAYTRGASIAFKQTPDLRLAAHEAAHVIQQRRGVSLKGEVGSPGDMYERQADAAADAVVAGRSAEHTLDANAPPGSQAGQQPVQKACSCGGACSSCASGGEGGSVEQHPVQRSCSCGGACSSCSGGGEGAPIQQQPVQKSCSCGGSCSSCSAGGEDAPIQQQLEVNATRTYEPPEKPAMRMPGADKAGTAKGTAPEKAAGKGQKKGSKPQVGDALSAARASEPGGPGATASMAGGSAVAGPSGPAASGPSRGGSPAARPGAGASGAPGAAPTASPGSGAVPGTAAPAPATGAAPAAATGGPTPTAGPAGTGAPGAGGTQPATGQTETSGAGQPACSATGLNAVKYTGGYEEPDPEPDEKAPDPESTKAKEEMKSQSPDVVEPDNCPIEQAVQAQAGDPAANEGKLQTAALAGQNAAGSGGSAARAGAAPAPAVGGGAGAAPAGPAATGKKGAGRRGGGGAGGGPGTEGAGGPEGEDGEAAPQTLEGAIADTEGRRDAAVEAYGASQTRLQELRSSVPSLAEDVQFAPAEGEVDAAAMAREANARGRTNTFFANVTDRLGDTLGTALGEIPERIGGLAEALKSQIQSSMETEKEAISARIAQARSQAWGNAAAARATVNAAHDDAVFDMEAETESALDTLETEHGASLEDIDQQETDGLDKVNALHKEGYDNHVKKGDEIGGLAIKRGQEYVDAYEKFKIYEDDSFWAGRLTDRRAEAQQKAAKSVAEGTDKSLREAAKKQAGVALKGRQNDRCGVIAIARRSRATLDQQYDAIVPLLKTSLEDAKKAAGENRDQMIASIDAALASQITALNKQEHDQRQSVDDSGYLQQVAIEQAAHAAIASLQGAVATATDSLTAALQEMRGTLAETQPPEPAQLNVLLGQMAVTMAGAFETLLGQVESGSTAAEERLNDTATRGTAALADISRSSNEQATASSRAFAGSMTSIASGAQTAFTTQSNNHAQQTQETRDSVLDVFDKVVSGFDEVLTKTKENVKTGLAKSVTELEKSLRDSLKQLDCEIPKQAEIAASKEQPAWKKVVAVVLIIAVIIVVAVVAGPAVIGAVGAAAGALGASAAAAGVIGTIVGGAIIGAATSATMAVINNWSNGERLTKGVLRAAAIGALTGFIGGGAGAIISKTIASGVGQFVANLAVDSLIEIGSEAISGDLSWENFGKAFAMSLVMSGFGKIKRVERIQQRVQYKIASKVPGAGAHVYAESIKPREAPAVGKQAATGEPETRPAVKPASEAEIPAPTKTAPDAEAGASTKTAGEAPTTRSSAEIDAAAAKTKASPKSGAELDVPASKKTDTDLAATTTQKTTVGAEEHAVSFRKKNGKLECEVCSAGCGNVKGKIKDLHDALPAPPAHEKLRADLADLHKKVSSVEQGIENHTISHKDAIKASAEIAATFKTLGESHPDLGKALGNPNHLKEVYDVPSSPGGTARVKTDGLGARVGPREVVPVGDRSTLTIKKGQKVVYVLRDKTTGAILKVGQTKIGGPADIRFGRYNRAANRLNKAGGLKLDLELEITPVTRLGRGQSLTDFENALRARVESAGNVLPWDYSKIKGSGGAGRLGRKGPGVPFELPSGRTSGKFKGYTYEHDPTATAYGYFVPPGAGTGTAAPIRAATTPRDLKDALNAGLSTADIAKKFGVTPSTVRSWKSRWARELAKLK